MVQQTLELLKKCAKAHSDDKYRKFNTVLIPGGVDVVVAGDLHGNRRNFERIVTFSDLGNTTNHLVLQEIIHGGPEDEQGGCRSYELLLDAAELKLKFPDRVHFVMGNHDTAFISHSEVMKNGKEMNQSMRSALKHSFGQNYEEIELEMARMLFAQPLAVKCENRVMISHSLPAERYFDQFDATILDRNLKINDIVRPQSAYLLTWGRRHSIKMLDKLASLLDVDIFVVGHQPQETGFKRFNDRMLIIASDHNHGVIMKFNSSEKYTIDQLVKKVVPLASII